MNDSFGFYSVKIFTDECLIIKVLLTNIEQTDTSILNKAKVFINASSANFQKLSQYQCQN